MEKQYCDICGAEIPTDQPELKCPNCGTVKDISGKELILVPSDWGKLTIDLSEYGCQFFYIFNLIREFWISDLELYTSQGLFRGQFLLINEPVKKLVLYGPTDSEFYLKKYLNENHIEGIKIEFKKMEDDEVDVVRNAVNKKLGWNVQMQLVRKG